MDYEGLKVKLQRADELSNIGNYFEAERLTNEMQAEYEIEIGSIETQTLNEVSTHQFTTLISLSISNNRRADFQSVLDFTRGPRRSVDKFCNRNTRRHEAISFNFHR